MWFKKDMPATREARRSGRFLSRDSRMTLPREVFPGHDGPHELLAGADMRRRYAEVASEEKVCRQCGQKGDRLDMDHIVSRGRGGCDDRVNLQMLCWRWDGRGCHQKKHLERTKS